MFPTNPELQIEIEKITEALMDLGPDQILTYDEINRLLGYDMKKNKPWVLMKAKQRIEKLQGLRLATVRAIGVKKLPASQVPGIGAYARAHIGRVAKRTAHRLQDLKYNDIDKKTQSRIDAERSLMGAISAVASTQAQHVASMTKTGPVVAAQIFDYVRPDRVDGTEEEDADA
jgi:hypothetical protein